MATHRLSPPLRTGLLTAALTTGLLGLAKEPTGVIGSSRDEYRRHQQLIDYYRKEPPPSRLAEEALRSDALIRPTDHDPLDVVLRRTRALISHLGQLPDAPDLSREEKRLAGLEAEARRIGAEEVDERRQLFAELIPLRREIAFRNPLLDFTDIVFLTHHKQGRGERHMVDQYEGHNARPGGGLYILRDAFGSNPTVEDVLANATVQNGRLQGHPLRDGSFISLELDYEARTVYFAWTQAQDPPDGTAWEGQYWTQAEAEAAGKGHYYWSEETCYHVFRVNLDGTELVQLTDGPWNDFDPCVLPNGRIAFVSERRGGFLRCGARPNPTFTLHGMMRDGSDILPLSSHETHEWHPSVSNDGMIVYSRWDYVDRDSDIAHHPWSCYPDGRDPRAFHGNYPTVRETRPWMELAIRAVPNSTKFVATAAAHHGENYGSLVLVDRRRPDDGACSQLRRVTPEVHFPESEQSPGVPGPSHQGGNRRGQVYGQPWPLSEDFFLCVYDPAETHYGLCLLDSFGNQIALYTDPKVPCLDPIPLRPRSRPPVIPTRTSQALADRRDALSPDRATVAVMNVYDAEFAWPAGTRIEALRVVQVFPKTTRVADKPSMGVGNQSLGRGVLGTVPVESDGSAYFEVPPDVPVYFQALDQQGRAVQSMRSLTYAHRGEHLACQGCHEGASATMGDPRPGGVPLALRRAPTPLRGDVEGSWPLTFARLVQPVLDRQCANCHQQEEKAPSLSSRLAEHGWSEAYHTLGEYAWAKHGGNGWLAKNRTSYSVPGDVGARASKLVALLEEGHEDVALSNEDWHRITLWLDLNSNFYGVYHDLNRQASGEAVRPILE